MPKLRGFEEVDQAFAALEEATTRELVREFDGSSVDLVGEIYENTSHPFQEVPSYIEESRHARRQDPPDLRYKEYPEGTIGTFAEANPQRIAGTPWAGQTQLYLEGDHVLREHLQREPATAVDGVVTAGVGYDESISNDPDHYVRHVIDGTIFMQPRNFPGYALNGPFALRFLRAVERGVRRALFGVVTA